MGKHKRSKLSRRERSPSSSSSSSSESSSSSRSRQSSVHSELEMDLEPDQPLPEEERKSIVERLVPIPRTYDFATASEHVPDAPTLKVKAQRPRVRVDDRSTQLFEDCASGKVMSRDERESFLEVLPLPTSIFALPPMLDDRFPIEVIPPIRLQDGQLCNLQALLCGSLSSCCMAHSEIISQDAVVDENKALGFLRCAMQLLGAVQQEITHWRRENTLRTLRLDPNRAIPGLRGKPLGRSSRVDSHREIRPLLFGSELMDIMKEGGVTSSDIKKTIDALRKDGLKKELPPIPSAPAKRTTSSENRDKSESAQRSYRARRPSKRSHKGDKNKEKKKINGKK